MAADGRTRIRWTTFARAQARRFFSRARTMLTTEPTQASEHDAADVAEARELARAAGDLKGGIAKVAQLMGYLEGPGAVDDEDARALLGALWDRAPAADREAVRRVIVEDLGAPPEEKFASWDDTPFAAASLGEVHAATGEGGVAYAVKVQYPGVADALRSDLESKTLVARLAGAGVGKAISDDAVRALRDAVLRELDYVAEGKMLERFGRAYAKDSKIVIPRFVPERSSARVLTAERLTGRTLAEIAAATPEERARTATTIFRFAWGAPLRHGLLNADPNPGNYLALDGQGRVGFFDFGCAVELAEEVVEIEKALWRAVLERDGEALRYAVHCEGLLGRAITLDSDTFRAWERFLAGPFLAQGAWEWTPAYARGLAELTSQLVRAGGLTLPPTSLMLWRARLGVVAVIGSLSPKVDFRSLLGDLLRR
jgi:predicted unusual protein kinase regulating ubiquinone biosynthesis (AarF/ABC1/UbiB family)